MRASTLLLALILLGAGCLAVEDPVGPDEGSLLDHVRIHRWATGNATGNLTNLGTGSLQADLSSLTSALTSPGGDPCVPAALPAPLEGELRSCPLVYFEVLNETVDLWVNLTTADLRVEMVLQEPSCSFTECVRHEGPAPGTDVRIHLTNPTPGWWDVEIHTVETGWVEVPFRVDVLERLPTVEPETETV